MEKIKDLEALEILDSRGNPTIQATIVTESGIVAKAAVPSGASTGEFEAVELRDGDKKRFFGRGVLRAVDAVRGPLKKLLIGQDVLDQRHIDELMITADGTPNKERLGANAILSVSLASARAAALAMKMPLFRSLGEGAVLPCPMMNVINGGVHADSGLDFQEFMIRPKGFSNFADALRAGVELFHTLKASLKKRGLSTSVGDEGGFAPNFSSHEEALDSIVAAIQALGYTPGKEISLALDCAASELYDKEIKKYVEKKRRACGEKYAARSAEEQVAYLETLVKNYPIDSIEDGLSEHDWAGWKQLMDALGDKIQIVGDDIFVTNIQFLERGVKEKVANAILIKLNQIGTLTETMDTIQYAKENGFNTIISHRSGETEDNFIADLAVAVSSGQIKTGAPSRSDRVSKYNRLLEIEKELGSAAVYRQ